MLNIQLNYKKLTTTAIEPHRGSEYAAGYDLHADLHGDNDFRVIKPGETVKIGTGIAMEIHEGMFGAVFARSGLSTKQGLAPANKVGVIDSDYRGEVIVALYNQSNKEQVVHHGDRIAQLVIMPFFSVAFNEVEELSDTERGDGGFGHSGVSVIPEASYPTEVDGQLDFDAYCALIAN